MSLPTVERRVSNWTRRASSALEDLKETLKIKSIDSEFNKRERKGLRTAANRNGPSPAERWAAPLWGWTRRASASCSRSDSSPFPFDSSAPDPLLRRAGTRLPPSSIPPCKPKQSISQSIVVGILIDFGFVTWFWLRGPWTESIAGACLCARRGGPSSPESAARG